MKLAPFILGIIVGIVLGKSGLIDVAAAELAKIQMPPVKIPENPFIESLKFLLEFPSINYIAFALGVLIIIAIAWWIGGAQNAKKILVVAVLAIIWGLISYIIRYSASALAIASTLSFWLVVMLIFESGSLKEKEAIVK